MDKAKDEKHTGVWKALSKWLDPDDENKEYWWNVTGPHLSTMLEAAECSTLKQVKQLLAYYEYAIPFLGHAPLEGVATWRSLLTLDGTPIEYSWTWNLKDGTPKIRFALEAIDDNTGSWFAPFNHFPSTALLCTHFAKNIPGLDLTWFNYLRQTLYDDKNVFQSSGRKQRKRSGAITAPFTSTMSHEIDLGSEGPFIKTRFIPRKAGKSASWSMKQWDAVIRELPKSRGDNIALDTLISFLDRSAEGRKLKPFMLAIDNLDPTISCLELFFHTKSTSFDSIREIMTMGNLLPGRHKQIDDMQKLIRFILGLSGDDPNDKDFPPVHSGLPGIRNGYLYSFDIGPRAGNFFPEITVSIPVFRWNTDDRRIALGMCAWMKEMGRGRYCDGYMRVLATIAEDVGCYNDLHTYVRLSCMNDGQFGVTSYLNPSVYARVGLKDEKEIKTEPTED
ncbi:aromatic prenyltransferase [Pleomassaria siparia CBS 279.74]|uniref:Aromatic prenyltransferase n=1 Tax=Pleomassaria siparia CBS 279.74 TaxID=1314801 RepID=A0A6G1KK68_9PLEO|nr:aromatic prenyltransferase [Pleomassaria siparia CBS 279.74]